MLNEIDIIFRILFFKNVLKNWRTDNLLYAALKIWPIHFPCLLLLFLSCIWHWGNTNKLFFKFYSDLKILFKNLFFWLFWYMFAFSGVSLLVNLTLYSCNVVIYFYLYFIRKTLHVIYMNTNAFASRLCIRKESEKVAWNQT